MKRWILIADAGSCRIYETDEAMESLTELRALFNERIHLETKDLVSDQRGASQAFPGGSRTSLDRHTDPHEVERVRFAKEIAALLEHTPASETPGGIVIAAPPRFLGDLRAALSEHTLRRVIATVHHDFVKTPLQELPERLRAHLPKTPGADR